MNTRNKMNVRLAVETFSNSSAMSMIYLQSRGIHGFKNSTPTYLFAELMDKLFDIFNSKRVIGNSFKSTITIENWSQVDHFLKSAKKCLKRLQFYTGLTKNDRTERCKAGRSMRSTGFLGYLMNMSSLRHLLESFFGRVRSLLGNNYNLSVQEFKGALRKLIFFQL